MYCSTCHSQKESPGLIPWNLNWKAHETCLSAWYCIKQVIRILEWSFLPVLSDIWLLNTENSWLRSQQTAMVSESVKQSMLSHKKLFNTLLDALCRNNYFEFHPTFLCSNVDLSFLSPLWVLKCCVKHNKKKTKCLERLERFAFSHYAIIYSRLMQKVMDLAAGNWKIYITLHRGKSI